MGTKGRWSLSTERKGGGRKNSLYVLPEVDIIDLYLRVIPLLTNLRLTRQNGKKKKQKISLYVCMYTYIKSLTYSMWSTF